MSERRLRERLRDVAPPDREGAEERAWRVVDAAFQSRAAPARDRRARRRLRALAATAALAAIVAVALTPPGAAVGDWVSDVVTPSSAPSRPALTSLPTGGRVLVESARGPWVVHSDGSKRRLGRYREAGWSPGGLFVVVASGRELAAVEPDGTVRWTLARPRPIRHPAWSPDGFRIAYLSGRELRVVAGDGTGDGALAPANASVTPIWRPNGGHVLAYLDRADRIVVVQTDAGRRLWRRPTRSLPHELLWTDDGQHLVAISDTEIEVFAPGDGGHLRTIAMPAGARAGEAAIHPDGDTLALARSRPATGRGEIVTYSIPRGAAGPTRRLFVGSGSFDGMAWSPDGRWLLAGWPDANQWLFIRSAQVRQVRAIDNIRQQFDPGRSGRTRFPTLSGWCCRFQSKTPG